MNKWLIGLFAAVVGATISLAVAYPEKFAMSLGFLVLGFSGGMLVTTTLMKTYFTQGLDMAHELYKKQVINPATIMRETRLQDKDQTAQTQPAIPRFNITGV